MKMMIQVFSFALFASVMLISILAIVATVKAELPYILRALGIDTDPLPPLRSNREPRVRVTRPLRGSARPSLRAAA
jgi:hypothetical protein